MSELRALVCDDDPALLCYVAPRLEKVGSKPDLAIDGLSHISPRQEGIAPPRSAGPIDQERRP